MITPYLDQITTIPRLLDIRYKSSPNQPIYVYAEDSNDRLTEIHHLEFIRACHRAAYLTRPPKSGPDHEVVAIIALVDVIVYMAVISGLMKAGLIPFPISPRNTPAAIIHLLKSSGAHRVLSTQSTLQELLQNLETELTSSSVPPYHVVFEEVPDLTTLFPYLGMETARDSFDPYPLLASYPKPDECAIYLHSSGSTGLPKAIPITHVILFKGWVSSGTLGQLHRHSLRIGTMSLPSFHAIGFFIQLVVPLYAGLIVGVYPPLVKRAQDTPFMATPDNIIEHLKKTHCNSCMAIPAMIKIWSQSPTSIQVLSSLSVLMFGGGPLPPATGDYLVSQGVHLRAQYGGTEFGIPVACNLDEEHQYWAWQRFSSNVSTRLIPQGDGTFELQCLNSDKYCVAVENIPDVPGYATSDLWAPHPTMEGLWTIVGRLDDVIIHSSGEKTIPGLFEELISRSPLIVGGVVFGQQRDQAGVLIEPSPGNSIDVQDEVELSVFRNKIWPIVDEANKAVPAFSRIYKEMILVTSSDKPLPRAGKGTILRTAAYEQYEKEIELLYEMIESNARGSSIDPPTSWNITTVQKWLLAHVNDLCNTVVDLSDDLFNHGFDSLCATILRVRIMNALRCGLYNDSPSQAISRVSQNIVYNHPTIASLAQCIVTLIDTPIHPVDSRSSHEEKIEDMISLYSKGLELPTISSEACTPSAFIVLLTGSTGNLGAQILEALLLRESVACVYTLNRPSSQMSIQQRHQDRFRDKGLDTNLLLSHKLVHLEADTSEPMLGLAVDVYNKLQNSLTIIIHNAWRVDFNLSLSSFDPLIRGMRNLIDLARSARFASSLRFLFISSVGSAQSWKSNTMGPCPEVVILDPQYAVGTGYGESKYISERILAKSGLHACSFRIGQITGGLPNGAWAMNDWIPMMIKTSLTMGSLPDAKGVVSWTPMDAVCQAILDVGLAHHSDLPMTINITHPHPVAWTSLMSMIRELLLSAKHLPSDALPLIPFQEWVDDLEKLAVTASSAKLVEIPAAKIIQFLNRLAKDSDSMGENPESFEATVLDTANIQRISKSMRELVPISRHDAERWVDYWVHHGI